MTTEDRASRLMQAHLYSDALIALSQADACRIAPLMRSAVLFGHSMAQSAEVFRRNESTEIRDALEGAQVDFLALTEEVLLATLQEKCGCRNSDEPARLIGDMF